MTETGGPAGPTAASAAPGTNYDTTAGVFKLPGLKLGFSSEGC